MENNKIINKEYAMEQYKKSMESLEVKDDILDAYRKENKQLREENIRLKEESIKLFNMNKKIVEKSSGVDSVRISLKGTLYFSLVAFVIVFIIFVLPNVLTI